MATNTIHHGYARSNPDRFPRCKLRGTRIVDSLPAGCPFGAPVALTSIHALQQRGYSKLYANNPDGADDLARAEICYQCTDRLAAHPIVRRARVTLRTHPVRTTAGYAAPPAQAAAGPQPVRVTSGTCGTCAGGAPAVRIQRLPRRRTG